MVRWFGALLLVAGIFTVAGGPGGLWADSSTDLVYGPYPVGFKLFVTGDPTRSYPGRDGGEAAPRLMRIYLWYPASAEGGKPLTIGDFAAWAAEDFDLPRSSLPVPLARGLDEAALKGILARPLKSGRDLPPEAGNFPLLVLGQGLYYESPLSQVILCEYLASRGFIVATCPLVGTRYRLTNMNAEDLETQVRDMEFVLAEARSAFGGKIGPTGLIGYDLGGMAGLLLAMRRPEISAFLSLDSGIDLLHHSGLPAGHPGYREECFTIPWMHMTQARFVEVALAAKPSEVLHGRKKFGDTWMVAVPSENHGSFSSFATFGIRRAVRGYWEGFTDDAREVHDDICRLAGDFFGATLKPDDDAATARLKQGAMDGHGRLKLKLRKGAVPLESSRSLLRRIMDFGLKAVLPDIDRLRAANPGEEVLNEPELRWLAYHFLLWWGRENEAMETFLLNITLHPKSADAWAGLGEAHLLSDRTEEAISAFRKALELNPDLPGVKAALDALIKK